MLAKRLSFYVIVSLVVVSVLGQLGFNLSVLLGAAGILTVAIGFAAQTTASNLINGLFLMAEKPFVVGDWIKVDDVYGVVLSIDLLAVHRECHRALSRRCGRPRELARSIHARLVID
jgi:small-conductance mechanosensitive channel